MQSDCGRAAPIRQRINEESLAGTRRSGCRTSVLVTPADGAQQLLQQVWGPAYRTETNYLRVHLANLRRKLEPDPARPRYLITEPGIGYRFRPESSA